MKRIALLTLALVFAPGLAVAQSTSVTSPDTALPHPNFAAMQQMHAQMKQIHLQARQQILAALSPAHRALLANIAGQLAIAPNPDREAAARALDAALSPNEARAVLGIESSARTQSDSLMEAARAQFEATLTPDQRAEMAQRMSAHEQGEPRMQRTQHTPDAGRTLLELATGRGDRPEMGFGPQGPPPQ